MASKMKRQRLVFSEKLMYSFIRDYKDSGCLWDIKNPDYKSSEKRKAALANLASKYDITEEEAKRKLNSLRSTYLQEKKKVEESKKNGGEIYEPSLYWFHELEFLYDVIIPRKTPHHYTPIYCNPSPQPPPTPEQCQVIQREQTVEEINQEEVDEEHLIFEFVPDSSEKPIFTQKLDHASYTLQPSSNCGGKGNWNVKRRPLKKPPLPGHQQHLDELMDVKPTRVQPHERSCQSPQPSSIVQQALVQQPSSLVQQPLTQQTHVQQEDEFDTFCCSIASQLRTLPPADAIEMQLEIQQLVSRRRLAVLKSQQNIPVLRTWGNSEGYHQYHTQSSAMDNDSGQEEGSEKRFLGH